MSTTSLKNAPEPTGHWFFGSLLDFARDIPGFVLNLRAQHGPVVRFRLLRGINYLISDPQLIGEILNDKQDRFIKNRGFWIRFTGIFGQGLLTSEGETWKRQRKLAAPAFQPKRLAHYVDIVTERAQALTAQWQNGQVRDVHDDLMQVTAEVIAKAMFGVDLEDENHGIRDAVHQLEKQIAIRMVRPFYFLDFLPLPNNLRYWKTLRYIDSRIKTFITAHRSESADQRTLLAMLMDARDESGAPMSDKQLRDETITMFLAGHDTTAISVSWAIYLLSQSPDYWALLREEWQQVLQDEPPTWASLQNLNLTRGVIKESLRLYPPAYLFGREPVNDVDIGGFHVPKGVGVVISPYVMGRHPTYFENPDLFDPKRWTPEFEKTLPRYAFIPFGGGPRTCMGEGFAMMEAMVLLVALGRRFTLEYTGASAPLPLPSITLPPREGLKMRVVEVKAG